MHVPIKVKSPNNMSKWQMGFNSAFKGLNRISTSISQYLLQKDARIVYQYPTTPKHFENYDYVLDARGSVHHSKFHKEKSNKMQQCIKILLFRIYMKLNMFRVTHRPSSRA